MNQLIIEILCEELPVSMIDPAATALRDGVLALLQGVEHGEARLYSTPRRLAVVVDAVASERARTRKLVTGPPADRAFDAQGKPTKAALGFARGKGVDPSQLKLVDGPKGKVVAVSVSEGGEPTANLVCAGLDAVVRGLPFAKSMRWGSGSLRFARPLHNVAAVFQGQALEGTAAGLSLNNHSRGHRLADYDGFDFRDAEGWLKGLEQRKVMADPRQRKDRIRALLAQASHQLDADPIDDEALLDEVTKLVEWPVLVLGTFDVELLELPARLLIETMKVHQRYFPVFRDGVLTHHFVVISNNPFGDPDTVAQGNARVLRPRFYDARFFFAEDRKRALDAHAQGLHKMRWIRGLGTMGDKADRLGLRAAAVAAALGYGAAVQADANSAGALCKADLTSQMVGEFPKLQGHMGRLYAAASGASEGAALAIEEHYLPRYSDDALPSSDAGRAVALADRFDTLVACFGVGMKPKGGDPQGLRRAALGVVRLLVDAGVEVDLRELLRDAAGTVHRQAVQRERFEGWRKLRAEGRQPAELDALVAELVDFIRARFRAWKVADGLSGDLVDAVMAVGRPDPVAYHARVEALRAIAGTDDFKPIMHTFKRVLNITRGQDYPPPSAAQLTEDAERSLQSAVAARAEAITAAASRLDFGAAMAEVLELRDPVAHFFDQVLVDAPDPAQKAARMGLLLQVSALFLRVADFSRISTR